MQELLFRFFQTLDQAEISYAVLRDGDRLELLSKGGEVDLLLAPEQLAAFRDLAHRFRFVELPSWGYEPHRFFVAFDPVTGGWLKLDVVTELAFGRPIRALRTNLAVHCLSTRQHNGQAFVLSPECELVTLLLHGALDKGRFSPFRQARIRALRAQIRNGDYVSSLLVSYWLPTMAWERLTALIDAGDWDALLREGKAVAERLANWDRFGTLYRKVRGRVLRKLTVLVTARRPRSLSVALLAPDGAGKSTLAARLQSSFYFPVHKVYMGLYPKRDKRSKPLPGLGLALRLLSLWGRYLVARYHLNRRRLVIFDRYVYDALLPSQRPMGSSQRLRRWLLAHACPPPDMVLLLDAPADTLFARKGEHTPERLEAQRQGYQQLREHLPQLAVVDASRSPEQVYREATAHIWDAYCRRSWNRTPAHPQPGPARQSEAATEALTEAVALCDQHTPRLPKGTV